MNGKVAGKMAQNVEMVQKYWQFHFYPVCFCLGILFLHALVFIFILFILAFGDGGGGGWGGSILYCFDWKVISEWMNLL